MLLQGAARAREAALDAQERGDFDGARTHLREAQAAFLADLMPADAAMTEEMADLEAMEHRMVREEFSAADAKYLHQRAYNSRRAMHSKSARISRVQRPDPNQA